MCANGKADAAADEESAYTYGADAATGDGERVWFEEVIDACPGETRAQGEFGFIGVERERVEGLEVEDEGGGGGEVVVRRVPPGADAEWGVGSGEEAERVGTGGVGRGGEDAVGGGFDVGGPVGVGDGVGGVRGEVE